jgi:hypothetical protein
MSSGQLLSQTQSMVLQLLQKERSEPHLLSSGVPRDLIALYFLKGLLVSSGQRMVWPEDQRGFECDKEGPEGGNW